MDIKHYRVLNVLLNTNSVDRYTFCVIDIAKDIDTNKIYRARIKKGLLKENIIMDDVKKHMKKLFRTKQPDYVISTQKDLLKDSYHYDLYNRKDEHELSMLYITNFGILENLHSSLQEIRNQEGLFLVDGDSAKTAWKFDHSQLRMATFAFMFSLDLLNRNRTSALVKALMEE
ncbi:MAG: hypothetical protein ABXS91_08575 [Sulfurimonas sp.]